MQRSHLLVVAGLMLVTGCGSGPTSPSVIAVPLTDSIEMISASVPAGSTLRHDVCAYAWDFASCFPDLQFTFAVRSRRDAPYARLFTEFRTSDGRVCAETLEDPFQPIVSGVVTTFQSSMIYLGEGCFDVLPFETVTVLARVRANNPGQGIAELMTQEFSLRYTFSNNPLP